MLRKRGLMLVAGSLTVTVMSVIFLLNPSTGQEADVNLNELIANIKSKDSNLVISKITDMLNSPTSMTFINSNTILVTEKAGQVRLIKDLELHQDAVLDLQVDTVSERGLLGIGIMKNENMGYPSQSGDYIFLYATEATDKDVRNRIYRFDWNGSSMQDKVLIADLPGTPGPNHDGGKIIVDRDIIYAVIGDLNRNGVLQNFKDGPLPDDTSVILRINANGSPASDNPFAEEDDKDVKRYFAYGIRNSFGMAIDPVTGTLWDSENGPDRYDEINIVKAGFNSGWERIMGPSLKVEFNPDELVTISGSHYSDPEFSWKNPVGVTDIAFANLSLGPEYSDILFAGDNNNGNLYYFKINDNRTGLVFNGTKIPSGNIDLGKNLLSDLVADDISELQEVIFATGFGAITDIEAAQDGLYVLSLGGELFKIHRK